MCFNIILVDIFSQLLSYAACLMSQNIQAAAIMLYTQVCLLQQEERICINPMIHLASNSQETCLYGRLNAALRNHDTRGLAPFLPYMKLLLSALYQLPLTQLQTYRGVKLELFEVGVVHTMH